MDKYEEVMRELDEINDLIENAKREEIEAQHPDFKWEYAFESITEINSSYRRRVAHA